MKYVTTYSINAPGFAGLNTNDAPVDLDSKFSAVADNCIIDKYGRIGARKGWAKVTTNTNAELGTTAISAMAELIEVSGTTTLLAAGNNNLFKVSGATLTTLTYGGGGVAPVITASNWQMVGLGSAMVFFQRGYDPLIYDTALSTTQYRRMSEHPTYSGTILKANCALSAWGRIWCADTDTDIMTIKWSDTLAFQKWTAGTSGSLNLQNVWPAGGDRVVAIAAHNNNLVIFGTRQILIYQGADNPATMSLSDAISGVGCLARDSVQNTGSDLIFLSATGVRSIQRTIQEKSAPIGNISINVDSDIRSHYTNEVNDTTIKSVYSLNEAFYLITFITSGITYCFSTREPLINGGWKTTTWSGNVPKSYFYSQSHITYMGEAGCVGKYDGYVDNTSIYRGAWYTTWIDFGNPEQTSILKSIKTTIIGASDQQITFKWGFDYVSATASVIKVVPPQVIVAEYGVAEYGIDEYSAGVSIVQLSIPAGGSGKVVQVGVEFDVIGSPVSIQHFSAYTKEGRY